MQVFHIDLPEDLWSFYYSKFSLVESTYPSAETYTSGYLMS